MMGPIQEHATVSLPTHTLLADIYRHLPFLVFHITTDGIVLHCNPEACRVTGYPEHELVGKNLWGALFPGKLFAQVPRFISLVEPAALLKDVPMSIRTRDGAERVIGWSRYIHSDIAKAGDGDSAPRSFICVGVDLTDRLLNSDRDQLPAADKSAGTPSGKAISPHIGNAGTVDSEIVTPIAISPRPPGTTGPCPIEQVREGLARVETHMHCMRTAFDQGETQALAAFKKVLQAGTARQDIIAWRMLVLGNERHLRACSRSLGTIRARVDELLTLHKPELP